MIFLGIKDWLSNTILEPIGGAFAHGFRVIFFTLDKLIYEIITNIYEVFRLLCNSRLLSIETLETLSDRVGMLLGVIMLFVVVFSFIKMLVDPDLINDKNKGAGNIIKKVIIVIVMLGSSNFVFEGLYMVQKEIVESNIVGKLFLPNVVKTENFGGTLSAELFGTFYDINPILENTTEGFDMNDSEMVETCRDYVKLLKYRIYTHNDFELGHVCLNESILVTPVDEEGNRGEEQEVFIIKYSPPLSTVVGIAVIYFIFMYCISVGVRTIQIAFLEIISPMAIISYLSPKEDSMFKKWLKIYTSTYINLFIRIAIIHLIIFLIATILDNSGNSWEFWKSVANPTGGLKAFIKVIMILALLTFAKKAPDLLKDMLGSNASKLGFGASMKDAFGLGALIAGGAALGVSAIGRAPGVISNTGRAIGFMGKNFNEASGFKGKAGATLKGLGSTTKALVGGVGGLAIGGAVGAVRGGTAGLNAKGGVVSAARAGQQAQAKANLTRAQRVASGSTVGERVGDTMRGVFGVPKGYDELNQQLSMSSDIKSMLEKEDAIRHIEEAKQAYIANSNKTGKYDYNVAKQFDDAKNAALEQMYSRAYSTDDMNKWSFNFEIPDVDGKIITVTDEFKSNPGIHYKIKENERRAHKNLSSYSEYKKDNGELKSEFASRHKHGS